MEKPIIGDISPFSVAKIPACHVCFLHALRFRDLVQYIVHEGTPNAQQSTVTPGGYLCNKCDARLCRDCTTQANIRLHQLICHRGETCRKELWVNMLNLGSRYSESIPMAIRFCLKLALEASDLGLPPDQAFHTLYNSEGYFNAHQSVTYSENGFEILTKLLHPIPPVSESLFNQIISTFDRTNLYIEIESFSMMEDLQHPIPHLDDLNRLFDEGAFSAIAPSHPDDFPIPIVVGSAHYPTVARLNHSCDPNIDWRSVNGTNEIEIYAIRNINKGEELFISYIDQSLENSERQALLLSLYGFACKCSRCELE